MTTLRNTARHSTSAEATAAVNAGRVTDEDAAAIAAGWASPGRVGRHLAAYATGAPVDHLDLLDDIAATLSGATGTADRRELVALAAHVGATAVLEEVL